MPSAFCLKLKTLWIAAPLGAALATSYMPLASATTVVYSLTENYCSSGCGSGPFGTVTVSSVSSTEVHVGLLLAGLEVFAVSGAGEALLFDIAGNPAILVSGLTSGFTATGTASGNSIHADGTGYWQYSISCTSCGSGTSAPRYSGPINFDITVAGGITPTSFIAASSSNNAYLANSLYFATDIGVPNAPGGYDTGDVAALRGAVVPLPAAGWLLFSGLGGLATLARRRKSPAS